MECTGSGGYARAGALFILRWGSNERITKHRIGRQLMQHTDPYYLIRGLSQQESFEYITCTATVAFISVEH